MSEKSKAEIAAEDWALMQQYLDDETRPAMDLFLAGIRWLLAECEKESGEEIYNADGTTTYLDAVISIDKIKELVNGK